ncbi:MAG TPA: hypothetical protein VFA25_09830 [Actinomycetota bacterium]|nr:hypothetical protein [Actinomycetota bacterium]
MTRSRLIAAAAITAVAVAFTASVSGAGSGSRSPRMSPRTPYPTEGNGFDPANFDASSTQVDNRFFPLAPGTRFFYRGWTGLGSEREPHRVVFTVTDLTKNVAGVQTVVGWDRDFGVDGLEENELIFLAQDVDGNVWHLGQYPERYDGEQFDGAAPFLVGYLEGVMAGIVMPADPRPGTPSYSEGYAPPPYYWDDHARVVNRGERTCVPAGCFDHVLEIQEFEPLKPHAWQLKFYAPGVGYVRVGWRGRNDEDHEVLRLVKMVQLNESAMAKARTTALEMEGRASVYGLTPPLEPLS